MRKSKYLILSPLFLIFNDDLTKIINMKYSFWPQNELDLDRFNNLKSINGLFDYKYLNFIFFTVKCY